MKKILILSIILLSGLFSKAQFDTASYYAIGLRCPKPLSINTFRDSVFKILMQKETNDSTRFADGIGSAWNIGGNAGTSPGTNFIGTTDAQNLEFKVNGQLSGLIQRDGIGQDNNTSFGYIALLKNTPGGGQNNSAFGLKALYANTKGVNNSAFGSGALLYDTTGSNNVSIGYSSSQSVYSGYNLTIIGVNSNVNSSSSHSSIGIGYYSLVTANYQFTISDSIQTEKKIGELQEAIPATTDTVKCTGQPHVSIQPAGTIAVAKFLFPASPNNNDEIYFSTTQTITSFTMLGNGNTVLDPLTTLVKGTANSGHYIYIASITSWQKFQ